MNRIHNSNQAETCVKLSQDMGIENISIDLIYGINPQTEIPNGKSKHYFWKNDLEKAIWLHVPHISSYCLTIEEKTVFGKWREKNKILPIDDTFASEQFEILINTLQSNSYEQYEISNFAQNGQYSKHNTSYWKREEYLGVGPSAHSYNGFSRQSNISNNIKYLAAINQNQIPAQIEELTPEYYLNDYLMTGLRTIWGCEIVEIEKIVGNRWEVENKEILDKYLKKEFLLVDNQILTITNKGKLFADRIASDLFLV
jgi:oxygen-independent coproporphyrinogen-3 oxidase